MRTRESIYLPLGYSVTYLRCEKARGFGEIELCYAKKAEAEFIALRDPGHYARIMGIQDSIPHMAKFSEPAEHHILLEKARGKLIWDLDSIADIPAIERQLKEFAGGTTSNRLAHNDIRPWNVFLHDQSSITIIDWNLSRFLPDSGDGGGVDFEDARRFVCLLRGEMKFQDAWHHGRPIYPAWCRH